MPKRMNFVFSTDMYQESSIKDMERKRRGSSENLSIGGQLTNKPADWKNFLMNSQNKSQLVDVINEVWCSGAFAPKLVQRKVVAVVQGHSYLLESDDGITVKKTEIPELYSDQEETAARIVLYCAYAQEQGYDTVCICSHDSDVFFIMLHHASKFEITIRFATCPGNKRRLLNISDLAREYGQEMFITLMYRHAFTHCDTTSAYKGGSINLGQNVDLSQLPPCQKALHQHIRHANYEVGIWEAANIPRPRVPQATDGQGWTTTNGKLQPMWFQGTLIPLNIAEEDDRLPSDDDIT